MSKSSTTLIIVVLLLWGIVYFADRDYNCSDFETQEEALKVFDRHEKDIFGLDADGDNRPCEKLPVIEYL